MTSIDEVGQGLEENGALSCVEGGIVGGSLWKEKLFANQRNGKDQDEGEYEELDMKLVHFSSNDHNENEVSVL